MTTSVRPAAAPVEPPPPAEMPSKQPLEMATTATQTVRLLKPLPTTDAATGSTAAAATRDPVNDYKDALTEIRQQIDWLQIWRRFHGNEAVR